MYVTERTRGSDCNELMLGYGNVKMMMAAYN
jgi:hypothetical protein